MIKKLLLITDSLALPRNSPEKCHLENTWPQLLQQTGNFQIHQVSIGGATSTDLLKQLNYHLAFEPDIVVLQFGVVDCAPRFVSRFELEVLKRVPGGNRLLKFLNKPGIKKLRTITYTSASKFESNLLKIKKLLEGKKIIAIGIVPSTTDYDKILPGVTKNISDYNRIMNVIFSNFISLERMPKDGIMSDFHHLNAKGHQYIAANLFEFFKC